MNVSRPGRGQRIMTCGPPARAAHHGSAPGPGQGIHVPPQAGAVHHGPAVGRAVRRTSAAHRPGRRRCAGPPGPLPQAPARQHGFGCAALVSPQNALSEFFRFGYQDGPACIAEFAPGGAAVRSPRQRLRVGKGRDAAKSEGPSTYEMEGPSPAPGRASSPMTRRPVRCPGTTGYRAPLDVAGLPAPPAFQGLLPGLALRRW